MSPETIAWLILLAYLLIAIAVIARQALRCEHGILVWWLFVLNRLLCSFVWGWRSNRHCPFPDDGPALILANHRSPADPAILWMNLHLKSNRRRIRAINFLMAREFYEVKSLHWMFKALRSIPVERDGKDVAPVREALKRLKAGELIGVFPEGGINEEPGLKQANSGIAWLAVKAKVPIYPVFIKDSPIGATMISSITKRAHVKLIYGEPIDLTEQQGRKVKQEELELITTRLMTQLAELGGTFYTGNEETSAVTTN